MPSVYLNTTQAILPSGEVAEFTFYVTAATLADAVTGYDLWAAALAADTSYTDLFPTVVQFGGGKVSQVDEATGVVVATSVAGTPYAGTGFGASMPPQNALVVTLYSALAGRSDRGRFYLPGPAFSSIDVNGRFLVADALQVATSMVAAFNAARPTGWTDIIVYSRKNRSHVTATVVSVGNIIDTQRRRRDKLLETRSNVTI